MAPEHYEDFGKEWWTLVFLPSRVWRDRQFLHALMWLVPVVSNVSYYWALWKRQRRYASSRPVRGRHGIGPRHAAKTPLIRQLGFITSEPQKTVVDTFPQMA